MQLCRNLFPFNIKQWYNYYKARWDCCPSEPGNWGHLRGDEDTCSRKINCRKICYCNEGIIAEMLYESAFKLTAIMLHMAAISIAAEHGLSWSFLIYILITLYNLWHCLLCCFNDFCTEMFVYAIINLLWPRSFFLDLSVLLQCHQSWMHGNVYYAIGTLRFSSIFVVTGVGRLCPL